MNKITNIAIVAIIAFGALFRFSAYGSLYLSAAMLDTESYAQSSSEANSIKTMFTSRRPATTNLLYKLADSGKGCELISSSNPQMGQEGFRDIHPCFNNIVLLQNILSILGWSLLAWVVSRHIKSPIFKILSTIAVLGFGFTPQIAEWDSILSSESLSMSLFAIYFAILIELSFYFSENITKRSLVFTALIYIWLAIFIVWAFTRDVHIYAVATAIVMLIPLFFNKEFRKSRTLWFVSIVLAGVFIGGAYASQLSPRWQPSLMHAMDAYIYPYPTRLEYFLDNGMPQDRKSKDFQEWFNSKGMRIYGKFLILHPGFVATTAFELSAYLRSDFIQPHFKAPEIKNRDRLIALGEIFHPETNAGYIINGILLIGLCAFSIRNHNLNSITWTWLALWLFLCAGATLFISLFGDTDGTRRHIYPSVELFRLFIWIFLPAQIDNGLENQQN